MKRHVNRLIHPTAATDDRVARDLGWHPQRELLKDDEQQRRYLDRAQSVQIKKDTVLVLDEALCLDFTGNGVRVEQSANDCVMIEIGNKAGVPSVAVGAAAGTGATAAIEANSTDMAGRININTGTGGGAGTLAQVTFANAMPSIVNDDYSVILFPADEDAAIAATKVYVGYLSRGTTTWDINSTAALTVSTSHHWFYIVTPFVG